MGNRNVKTADEQNKTLNLYFQSLHDRLQFKRSFKEVYDISYAVHFLVERITAELGQMNGALKVKRIVRVGSMQEGTKIREPDEFDYLLVLEHLSRPGAVEIRRDCENGCGYGHVVIKDAQLQSQWSQCMDGDVLKSTKSSSLVNMFHRVFGYDKGIREEFYNTLWAAVASVRKRDICQTETGRLNIRDEMACHGPAFTVAFYWTPLDRNCTGLHITADLTPAIDLELTEEVVKESDVYDLRFYYALKAINRYMVVPCNKELSCVNGLCFRSTFTETEVQLLRTNEQGAWNNPQLAYISNMFEASVTVHHIKCYKVMKYLFEGNVEKPELFQSYTIKTLLLKHMCHCRRGDNLSLCVHELLDDCLQAVSATSICISSLFMNQHCLLQNKIIRASQSTLIKAIQRLKTSLVKVGQSDNFKTCSITKPHSVIYHYTNFYTNQGLGIYLDTLFKD